MASTGHSYLERERGDRKERPGARAGDGSGTRRGNRMRRLKPGRERSGVVVVVELRPDEGLQVLRLRVG